MPGNDPTHWLHRLDASEWLAAAQVELAHAGSALDRRAVRPAVVHARRAAGMAMNAVLCQDDHPTWGRSYMEHVAALCDEIAVPEDIRAAARRLRDTAPEPPTLLKLGAPDGGVLAAAEAIFAWARLRLS